MKNPFIEKNVDTAKVFDRNVLLFSLLGTVIIHGEIIFNKIAWHDDMAVTYTAWGLPLEHGRWLNQLFVDFFENFAGAESLGVINGILTGLFIGIIACLLFYIFDVSNKLVRFALSLVFITIPAIAGNFGYMSGSAANFFGILLCVISLFFVDKAIKKKSFKKAIPDYILAVVLAGSAMGQYQCFFTVSLSLLLIYLIKNSISSEISFPEYLRRFFGYIFILFLALIFYLVILKLSLSITHRELSSYSGIDSYGLGSPVDYYFRVKYAYHAFLITNFCLTANMFPFHWDGWRNILYAVIIITLISYIVLILIKKKFRKFIEAIICLALFPLALNFNFVLFGKGLDVDYHAIHSLHMYQWVLLFVLPFLFLFSDEMQAFMSEKNAVRRHFMQGLCSVMAVITMIIGCLYARYDNFLYMESEIRQEKAISYFTVLRSRVESVEGYNPAMKVYFINSAEQENSVDETIVNYDYVVTNPYSAPIVNTDFWYMQEYMRIWTGWDPTFGDEAEYADDDRVKAMPAYPSDGSIQLLDGNVIVKFGKTDK